MIEVKSLTRYYGRTRALHDVSFEIEGRSIVGFLGLNGAGKSTLLKILGGLLMPSAGTVRVDGVDATEAPDSLRENIGFLPEEPPLYRNMRVRPFLEWCGQAKGRSRRAVDERLGEVLEICDIEHVQDKVIEALSHGYRKRVGIAQAIIHDPELVILDEPISGLDPVQIVGMRDVLDRLREDCTVLVSSHILSEISETCDRILVLHRGELVADGSEAQLRERLEASARLELTVRGPREAVESALDGLDAVVDWTLEADSGRADETGRDGADERFEMKVRLEDDAREALVAALVDAGVGLRRLEESSGNLEEVFLGVTGESEGTPPAREQPARQQPARQQPASDSSPNPDSKQAS